MTPDELSEQIVWKGAPWKWLFHNPKGNGWCQRFGYDFRSEKDGGSVVYYVTKKAEALTERSGLNSGASASGRARGKGRREEGRLPGQGRPVGGGGSLPAVPGRPAPEGPWWRRASVRGYGRFSHAAGAPSSIRAVREPRSFDSVRRPL